MGNAAPIMVLNMAVANKKVLVTGANGFIGSHLTAMLLNNGFAVKAMVLPGTSLANIAHLDCEVVEADMTKAYQLEGIMQDVDVVYHLAAVPSLAWGSFVKNINQQGTENIMNAAVHQNVSRVVYMSSLVVHGFSDFSGADETAPILSKSAFTRPYIQSKIDGETLVKSFSDKLQTVIIRPAFNIYGPNDMLTSYELLSRLYGGKMMAYVGSGKSKLGYVYVENLAFGLLRAGVSSQAANQTYIIADYEPEYIHLKNLMTDFATALGKDVKLSGIPKALVYSAGLLMDSLHFVFLRNKMPLISTYIAQTSTTNLHFSPSKAIKEIGYQQQVSYKEGIERTVRWFCGVGI
jgi:nucleoside-diphosphate-sugar epimerase